MEYFAWEEAVEFIPVVHNFIDPRAGLQPNCGLDENSSVLDIFEYFYDEDIVAMICEMSNIYRERAMAEKPAPDISKKNSRIHVDAKLLTISELHTFFALSMLRGIIKKPNIEMYWTL